MSANRIILIISAWLLVSTFGLHAQTVRIEVGSQVEFEQVGERVNAAIRKKARVIDVVLRKGTYYYDEGHISIVKTGNDDVVLNLIGNGSVLIGKGCRIRTSRKNGAWTGKHPGRFDPNATYQYEGGAPVSFSTESKFCSGFVTVVDKDKKLCRVKLPVKVSSSFADGGYIYMTQWFRGSMYPIEKIEKDSVFFTADNLFETRLLYNVNWDWTYGLRNPRYSLINCRDASLVKNGKIKVSSQKDIYRSDASVFLNIRGSHLGRLSMKGITFRGNRFDPADGSKDNVILLYCSKIGSTEISDCAFRSVHSLGIRIVYVDNVTVRNCTFSGCYRGCIYSQNGSKNTKVLDNLIENSGLAGDNYQAVGCHGENFLVKGNTFRDFGYGAVASGVHYKAQKEHPVTGTICDNEIFQTKAYFDRAPMDLLMDSGGIYITTQTDGVTIRDNYIHDINGPKANRGILCDDGTCNVTICNNRIYNIKNLYAIDLRRVKSVETEAGSKVMKANVGNKIYGNKTDGKILFEKR